jgi:hypothetical protein
VCIYTVDKVIGLLHRHLNILFRLGMFDGCELIAGIIGTAISVPLNWALGNYATYTAFILCQVSPVLM